MSLYDKRNCPERVRRECVPTLDRHNMCSGQEGGVGGGQWQEEKRPKALCCWKFPLHGLLNLSYAESHTPSLLFTFSLRLKLGFSSPNRTIRGWLVGSCLGLSRGASGSCQLLFIGAQTLPRAGPQFSPHSHFLPVFLKMSRVHYLLPCVFCFINSCSPHLGNMHLSSRPWFSRPD